MKFSTWAKIQVYRVTFECSKQNMIVYRKNPLNLPWATKTLKPIISKTKKDILIW